MNAIRPYFDITSDAPQNNAGMKRSRPQSQSQSQSQVRRGPGPPIPYLAPQMNGFSQSSTRHPAIPNGITGQQYPTYSYTGLPTPATTTGSMATPSTVLVPQSSPNAPVAISIPPTPLPTEIIRDPSPPPAEESLPTETQFLETQYSAPKGSSSSSCDKPSNAQIQKSSPHIESDETVEDKPRSSTAVDDLISMDDEEIRYSPGLASHPALDPYEGTPWSRGDDHMDRNVGQLVFWN